MQALALAEESRPKTPGVADITPASQQAKTAQQQRLESLQQQIDLARKQKERAMWREASSPPKFLGKSEASPPKQTLDTVPPEDPKHTRGFFAKLRQGKLFG